MNTFKAALLGSAILYFMLSINSVNPFGWILLLAFLMISSVLSAPSFLTFQSLFLNKAKSLAFRCLVISSLGRASSSRLATPPLPALPPSSAASPLRPLLLYISPFLRGVTLLNSSSISFIVDSLISFKKFFTASPACLYSIANNAIDAVLT